MINQFKRLPFYVILLPLSFVLHGYNEHFGFISALDAGSLALTYCAFSLCVFLLSWWVFKDIRKAGIMTAAWIGTYLLFGAALDFLRVHSPFRFAYRYRFIIPFLIIGFLTLFFLLKKTRHAFYRTTLFLNTLFMIYLSIDLVSAFWKSSNPPENKLAVYDFARTNKIVFPDSANRPDLYLLLFDEYGSSISLKSRYNFNNTLDSFLVARGFRVLPKSTSNYNYTPFSMASTLNMEYLNWVRTNNEVDREDFLRCNPAILQNEVIKILGGNGYDIVNLSVFDLAGHPSRLKQSFIPVKTKMIAEGTMFPRFYNDFEWVFINSPFLSKLMGQDYFFQHIENNELLFREVFRAATEKSKQPRFIYAHFYMPHEPFFFDENGNRKDNNTVVEEYKARSATAYIQYVQYANKRIEKLVDELLQKTAGNAAILILSDHGFRKSTPDPHPAWHFQNMNAVYFPGKNYQLLYDSISNVNQFRVVFNSLFAQQFPLLKDSTVYLTDFDPSATPDVKLPNQ